MSILIASPFASGGGGSSLLTNLAASWKLDDLTDSSGNGNTLTNNNSATFNTGKIGNAVYLTAASSQFLSMASNSFVQTGDVDFTIGLWVYLADLSSYYVAIAKRGDTAGQDEYVIYYDAGVGRFVAEVYKATDSSVVVTANNFGAPSATTWYCVMLWHDSVGDTVNISVNNGTADSTATGGALQAASNGLFTIGEQDQGGGFLYWNGRIDDANIWKRVLSGAERTNFYNSGTGREYPF